MTDIQIQRVLELALLTSQSGPLPARALARMFADSEISEKRVRAVLSDLGREWESRALELRETAGGFQFVSRGDGMEFLRRLAPRKPYRLSRPLTEILAFIAYRQPATRGDVERARGIAVSTQQIAALEEYGWIEEVGRRETPGRPALYATTKTFLDDLGLASLEDLPEPEIMSDESETESDSESASVSESESVLESETDSESETVSDSAADAESDSESDSDSVSESKSESGARVANKTGAGENESGEKNNTTVGGSAERQ